MDIVDAGRNSIVQRDDQILRLDPAASRYAAGIDVDDTHYGVGQEVELSRDATWQSLDGGGDAELTTSDATVTERRRKWHHRENNRLRLPGQ